MILVEMEALSIFYLLFVDLSLDVCQISFFLTFLGISPHLLLCMHACVLLIFQAFQDFFFLFSSSSLDSIAQRKIFKSQIFIHHGFILSQFSPASICKFSMIPTLLFILFPAASVFMNVGQMKIQ